MQLITYLQRFQGALFLDRSVDPSHLAFLLAAAGGQFTWPKYLPENLPENLPEKTSHQKVTLKKIKLDFREDSREDSREDILAM